MKKVIFYSVALLIPIGVIEALSYFSLAYLQQKNLTRFDVPRYAHAHFSKEGYKDFLSRSFDSDLGWRITPKTAYSRKNCLGRVVTYEYGGLGQRIDPDAHTGTTKNPLVATYGDSFTHGDDVDFRDTWQHFLSMKLSRDVLNFGVGGYGSYQAVLRFIRHSQRGFVLPYTILVIYEENIRRVANIYRPFYLIRTGAVYAFKPFIDWNGGRAIFHNNPNEVPRSSLDAFTDLVRFYERKDYWSKHRNVYIHFPFSLSLVRLIVEQHQDLREKIAHKFGAPAEMGYQKTELAGRLEAVISLFVQHSLKARTKPIVLFLPQISHKQPDRSYGNFLQKMKELFSNSGVVFIDVADAKADWEKFNPRPSDCHTSPYGNAVIAEQIYDKLLHPMALK